MPACECVECGVPYANKTVYGWVCHACENKLDELERTTDWDAYEEAKRKRIQEDNEY